MNRRIKRIALTAVLAAATVDAQPVDSVDTADLSRQDTAGLRAARNAQIAASDFVAALRPAQELVDRGDSDDTAAYSQDVLYLAQIQTELEQFDAAESNYLKAIEMLEAAEGNFAPSVIGYYQSLGRSYLRARRFSEAIAALRAGRELSRRNDGLFNVKQTGLIDDLTMAHLGLGETGSAKDLQEQRLENAVREFGEGDPRTVPFHFALGEYYSESRLQQSAREQHDKILQILDAQQNPDESQRLASLRSLVRIELQLGDRDDALRQLASVVDENGDIAAAERGPCLLLLGDAAIVRAEVELAEDYYRQAYAAFAASELVGAEALFARPASIDFIAPLNAVDRGTRSRPWSWGSITLEFDVSADGRAYRVRTVSMEPGDRLRSRYERRIRETHFRPRLAAGTPVATENVQFSHYFRYYYRED